ncbi:MAG: DM13 domain-containing protein [Litorimonas sp.]
MTNTLKAPLKARVATLAAVGILYPVAALSAALCATAMFSGTAHAAELSPAPVVQLAQTQSAPIAFQKKSFSLKGDVRVERRGDRTVLVFSDDFRTKRGPDLKVFLSRNSVATATGANATTGAVRLGELKSNRGGQEYVLPDGIDLAQYGSVLVHCEAFSKLWGGADL